MKHVKSDTSIPKITYRKCQMCSAKTDVQFLYKILDKWACVSCGNQKMREWNKFVSEVSPETINTESPR